MAGLYIHIPFCKKACNYCNFFFSTSLHFKTDVVESIIQEFHLRESYFSPVETIETIYFGGGTPSTLSAEEINRIIDSIANHYNLSHSLEITLEANPDDLSNNYFKDLKNTPINRLSIGIQSFHEEDLLWMRRAHTAKESFECIQNAQSHGYDNLTIDLIFGVPSSSAEKWATNLTYIDKLGIAHASCYALTVEDRTLLAKQIRTKKVQPPIEEAVVEQFYITHDYLTSIGFRHYEISNYAKTGFEAIHNSNYWKGISYLGLGPSAHSFNGFSRSWNVASIPEYIKGVQQKKLKLETEILTNEEQYNEFIMINLRRQEGINRDEIINRFPQYIDYFDKQLGLIDPTFILQSDTHIALSRNGLIMADHVSSQLIFV